MSCRLLNIFLLGLGILCPALLSAQSSLDATGYTTSSNSVEVSYSLGQFAFQEIEGNEASINPGVQQPFQVVPLSSATINEPKIRVFPNPTLGDLYIEFDHFTEPLSAHLFTAHGELISRRIITTKTTRIPLHNLSGGVYILSISMNSKTQQTFKVIVKS